MRDFRDLNVWQSSHRLTLAIYRVTESFPRSELFGLVSQMRRASSSIGANLAEGCGRWGDGDMGRFVQIAMGSASELHNLLLLASDLAYIDQTDKANLFGDISEVRRMLTALFKRVRRIPTVPQMPA